MTPAVIAKGLPFRVLCALLFLVAVATARQFAIGARGMTASDEALARGDMTAAIDEARSAAEARAPASPYPARGFERLVTISRTAEQNQNLADAARAWHAVRSAALATRVLEDDGRDRIEQANTQLARIEARRSTAANDPSRASLETQLQGDLARNESARASAYAALAIGSILFFFGIGALVARPRPYRPLPLALLAAGTLLAALGCYL